MEVISNEQDIGEQEYILQTGYVCQKLIYDHNKQVEQSIINKKNLGSFYRFVNGKLLCKSGVGPLKAKSGELIVDDYRPIYLTSCFSKTFERIVKQQILAYMFQQQLIMRQQFGFLSKCSTYIGYTTA